MAFGAKTFIQVNLCECTHACNFSVKQFLKGKSRLKNIIYRTVAFTQVVQNLFNVRDQLNNFWKATRHLKTTFTIYRTVPFTRVL